MSIKISELPETSTIGNDDLIAIVQENSTKKIKFSNFIEQGKQITIINEQYTKEYYLDENFKTLVAQPITEGIYYNITPTTNPVKLITSYDEETYGYTTIPSGSYLVIYPVDIKSSGMIGATDRFYKYLLITRGDSADDRIHIISGISEAFKSTGFMPRQFMTNTISEFENTADRVGTVDENSTEDTYPNTKAVYDALELKQAEIDELYDQIPTATATGTTINVQDSSNLPIKDFAMLGNATQADTPTPDTPQDIHVVTGDNTVNIGHKNIFNFNDTTYANFATYTISGQSINVVGTGSNANGYVVWNIPVGIGKTYTISYSSLVEVITNTNNRVQYGFVSSPVAIRGAVPENVVSKTNKYATATATEKYLAVALRTGNEGQYTISDLQVECNSTNTSYEPYITPTTQLISLGSIELAKIGDYTDKLFKAVSGNSIYDSLDSTTKASLTSGKWYKQGNMQKAIFTGADSEEWDIAEKAQYPLGFVLRVTITSKALFVSGQVAKLLCNSFVATSPAWADMVEGTSTIANTGLKIIFATNKTIEAMKTYASEHNIITYYALETPTYTEITDTTLIAQLENVLKMHTNKNVTNAWIEPSGTNAQAGLTLTYYRDLQTITDKIDSLEARVSLLE